MTAPKRKPRPRKPAKAKTPGNAWNKRWRAEVCSRVAAGNSLRSVCKADDLPSLSTVMKTLADPDEEAFNAAYRLAVEERAEVMFEEIIEIADDTTDDVVEGEDGTSKANHAAVQRSRVRIEARKWSLSKMQPKKYGNKLDVDATVDLDPLSALISDIHKNGSTE